jgi:hypothetical protein
VIIETPTGEVNGVNTEFEVNGPYSPGSLVVFWNGVLCDYNEDDPGEGEFSVTHAPCVGCELKAHYLPTPLPAYWRQQLNTQIDSDATGLASLARRVDIDVYQGNSRAIIVTVTDQADELVDLTGCSVSLSVAASLSPTSWRLGSGTTDSLVTILPQEGATIGQVRVNFPSALTASLNPARYLWDLHLDMSESESYCLVCPSLLNVRASLRLSS